MSTNLRFEGFHTAFVGISTDKATIKRTKARRCMAIKGAANRLTLEKETTAPFLAL
jgi:hypothetical protein